MRSVLLMGIVIFIIGALYGRKSDDLVCIFAMKWHIKGKTWVVSSANSPNRQRFLLPISSLVTILLGSLSIILPFAFMAYLSMPPRNMLVRESKLDLSRDWSHDLRWV